MENPNKFKVLIIHHNADMDGIVSGVLANQVFRQLSKINDISTDKKLVFDVIGYNYGKDSTVDTWLNIDVTNQYDYIQFIDITPPETWLEEVSNEQYSHITIAIFDHHKSAYDSIYEKFPSLLFTGQLKYFFDARYCGAWIYLYFVKKFTNEIDWNHKTGKCKYSEGIEESWIMNHIFYKFFIKENKFTVFQNLSEFLFTPSKVDNKDLFVSEIVNGLDTIIFNYKYIIDIVTEYDTWAWYPKKYQPKSKGYNPLYLNEGFMMTYKNTPVDQITTLDSTNLIDKGIIICDYLENQVPKRENIRIYEFPQLETHLNNPVKIAFVNQKVNFFITENFIELHSELEVPELYVPDLCVPDVVFYYTLDLVNNRITFSIRTINNMVNCSTLAKKISNGNGGGHFGAAGGSMSLEEFNQLLKLLNELNKQ